MYIYYIYVYIYVPVDHNENKALLPVLSYPCHYCSFPLHQENGAIHFLYQVQFLRFIYFMFFFYKKLTVL